MNVGYNTEAHYNIIGIKLASGSRICYRDCKNCRFCIVRNACSGKCDSVRFFILTYKDGCSICGELGAGTCVTRKNKIIGSDRGVFTRNYDLGKTCTCAACYGSGCTCKFNACYGGNTGLFVKESEVCNVKCGIGICNSCLCGIVRATLIIKCAESLL